MVRRHCFTQVDASSKQPLADYCYKDIEALIKVGRLSGQTLCAEVCGPDLLQSPPLQLSDHPGGVVIKSIGFGRLVSQGWPATQRGGGRWVFIEIECI